MAAYIRMLAFAAFLAALAAGFSMVLTGCGDEPRPLPPAGGGDGGSTLGTLGGSLVWAGGIGAAAGVALGIVSLVWPPLAPLAGLFRFAALGSVGVLAVGSSIQWLSDRPWLMVIGIVATVGALVWWYWPRLHRLIDRRLAEK
jgi:hypothetical protein